MSPQLGEEDFKTHVSAEAFRHSYHSLHFEFIKIDSRAVENELNKLKSHGWDATFIKILKQMAVSLKPA